MLLRGDPQMGGFLSSVTSAVTGAVKTGASLAVKPITYAVEGNVALARGILGAAAPLASQVAGVAAQGLRVAGQAASPIVYAAATNAESLLQSAGQAVGAVKGSNVPVTPPPSNMPLIIGGVAAAAILGFVLLRRRQPT